MSPWLLVYVKWSFIFSCHKQTWSVVVVFLGIGAVRVIIVIISMAFCFTQWQSFVFSSFTKKWSVVVIIGAGTVRVIVIIVSRDRVLSSLKISSPLRHVRLLFHFPRIPR
jgi:hypothetical protein